MADVDVVGRGGIGDPQGLPAAVPIRLGTDQNRVIRATLRHRPADRVVILVADVETRIGKEVPVDRDGRVGQRATGGRLAAERQQNERGQTGGGDRNGALGTTKHSVLQTLAWTGCPSPHVKPRFMSIHQSTPTEMRRRPSTTAGDSGRRPTADSARTSADGR
ncbi:hypothetical protein [Dactylosporangium sp. CS-033363]|uniref:hypothetical protein n=1 Tax=Dactylosporangium sp. CS-033363 TaxID=3239935 RepID=UPI003D917FFE